MTINNQHGGNLDFISKAYKISKKDIIDFSGNINPLGVPESIKNAIIANIDIISKYPDIKYSKLKKSISDYIGVPKDNIITGNGSTELISLFIKIIKPKKGLIISPAYSEYEKEIKLSGGKSILFPLNEKEGFKLNLLELFDALNNDIKLLVLCNPNNPTGSALNIHEIKKILEYCNSKNIFVMVDETYVEFTDINKEISSINLIEKYKNLFIIRGTSKFFASPGLRLGYAVCSNDEIIEKINKNKDPWSVNIFAETAGEIMFNDIEFINKTKILIKNERTKIMNELKAWKNIKLYETQANFILIKILNKAITAPQIFEYLIKYNIVIRDASDFEFLGSSFLRFCILSPEDNELLISKLKLILE